MEIRFTSEAHAGQVYIPQVNWLLLIGVLLLVLLFQHLSFFLLVGSQHFYPLRQFFLGPVDVGYLFIPVFSVALQVSCPFYRIIETGCSKNEVKHVVTAPVLVRVFNCFGILLLQGIQLLLQPINFPTVAKGNE